MYQFGSGRLVGTMQTSGINVVNPTPLEFGTLQDISLDIDIPLKMLYGQFQFALAAARSKGKIQGKAKFADIRAKTMADLFFGQALATGQLQTVFDVSTTVAATNTPIVPSSGVYKEDMGVRYAQTGVPFVRVAAGPTIGQYSVVPATGVYTFAAADLGALVLISFSYTVAASGQTLNVFNVLTGTGPEFSVILQETYNGKQHNLKLSRCMAAKLAIPTKQEDFMITEFDFEAFQPTDTTVPIMTFGEAE